MLRLASMQRLLEDLINEDTTDLPEDSGDEGEEETRLPLPLSPSLPPSESILFPFSSPSSQLKKKRKNPQATTSPDEKEKKEARKRAPPPQNYVYIPLDKQISDSSSSSAFSGADCSRVCKVVNEEDEDNARIKKALQAKKCPYLDDVFYQLYSLCQPKVPFSSSSPLPPRKAEKIYFSKAGDRLNKSGLGDSGSPREEEKDDDDVFYLRVKIRNRSYEDTDILSTSSQWVASYPPILPCKDSKSKISLYVLTLLLSTSRLLSFHLSLIYLSSSQLASFSSASYTPPPYTLL